MCWLGAQARCCWVIQRMLPCGLLHRRTGCDVAACGARMPLQHHYPLRASPQDSHNAKPREQ